MDKAAVREQSNPATDEDGTELVDFDLFHPVRKKERKKDRKEERVEGGYGISTGGEPCPTEKSGQASSPAQHRATRLDRPLKVGGLHERCRLMDTAAGLFGQTKEEKKSYSKRNKTGTAHPMGRMLRILGKQ